MRLAKPSTVEVGAVGAGDLALGLEVGQQGRVDPELLLEGLVGVGLSTLMPRTSTPFSASSGLTSW